MTFDAYGTGAAPTLRVASYYGFEFGEFNNRDDDRGYTFRNLKIDGVGTGQWGFWLRGLLRDVIIENVEITGFYTGIELQGNDPISNLTVRNNNIHRNRGNGIIGNASDSVFEGNTFEANNASGSTFVHGVYLSSGNGAISNVVFRNNRFVRNSVVGGVCAGGNLTVHGRVNGLTIEGNSIVQDNATDGCWGVSISPYTTYANQGFANLVVRNNSIVNVGSCAVCVTAAPGALIEGNTSWLTVARGQSTVRVADSEETTDGDLRGPATVRSNTACYTSGSGSFSGPAGSTVTSNVTRTGANATTDVCAR